MVESKHLPHFLLLLLSFYVLFRSSEEFESFSALFSDILLLKLFDVAADACYDNDKIKYNGVRALGNLLKYTQQKTLGKLKLSFHLIDKKMRKQLLFV